MDEDFFLLNLRRRGRRQRLHEFRVLHVNMRHLRDTSDPFTLPEITFRGLYRLNKELARSLIEELRPQMAVPQRVTSVPIEIKVLCALHFYGQGSYQRSAGSDRMVSLSQPSVSRAVSEVTEGLNFPQILGKWVRFPEGFNERQETIQKNYQATRIPGVLGYVDGTHIAIKAPKDDENLFYNRKNYHSMNAQIIADSNLKILNINAKYPGSTHDSFIWKHCVIRRKLVGIWEGGETSWLLGDSGYPHEPWLHTPILNAQEGTPEAHYTSLHIKGRSAVERTIGLLKGRFRCLLAARKLEYEPTKVGKIINACCVLHNMCILGGVPYEDDDLYIDPGMPEDREPVVRTARPILREARIVREGIIRRLQN